MWLHLSAKRVLENNYIVRKRCLTIFYDDDCVTYCVKIVLQAFFASKKNPEKREICLTRGVEILKLDFEIWIL